MALWGRELLELFPCLGLCALQDCIDGFQLTCFHVSVTGQRVTHVLLLAQAERLAASGDSQALKRALSNCFSQAGSFVSRSPVTHSHALLHLHPHSLVAPRAVGERNFWASIGEDTLSRSAPAPVKTVAAPVPKPPQSRQRKIDGLDFYEYVELIR